MFFSNVRKFPVTLCFSILILLSCKEERPGFPQITIFEPANSSSMLVPDTLLIRGEVRDENLQTVSITLLNADYIPVDVTYNIPVQRPVTSFAAEVPVTRSDIPEGNYFFRIRATNGGEYASAWVPVNIRQQSLERKGFVVASGTGLFKRIEQVGADGSLRTLYAGPGDYRFSTSLNSVQIGAVVPETTGPVRAFDLNTGMQAWQVDARTSGGAATFISASAADNQVWLGLWDGSLVRYNSAGQQTRTFFLQQGQRAARILATPSQLIVYASTLGGGQQQLLLMDQLAGFLIHEVNISGQVTAMTMAAPQLAAVAILGGDGQTRLGLFNLQTGNLSLLGAAFSGVVSSMAASGGGEIWFTIGNQIRRVLISSGQIATIRSYNQLVSGLFFDPVDNAYLYFTGQQIWMQSLAGGPALVLSQAPAPILGFSPIYSR
jgi:hypothetical protein